MRLLVTLAAFTLLVSAHSIAQESPDLIPPRPGQEIALPEEAVQTSAIRLDRADLEAWWRSHSWQAFGRRWPMTSSRST